MRRAQPEHALQVKICQWVRECVPQPHLFHSCDRAAKQSALQHVREKARGAVPGFPDTILLVPLLPLIAIELKAPGNNATMQQLRVGEAIMAAGGIWGCVNTVRHYCALLQSAGVPLRAQSGMVADHYDAVLAGAAIKADERGGKVSAKRKPAPRFTAGKAVVGRARRAGILV